MIYFDKNKNTFGNKIENPIASTDDETWHKHCINPCGSTWDIINGEFVDLRESSEYLNQQRLKEIEKELTVLDNEYQKKLDTPVVYPANGFSYKPKYAQDTYISLLSAGAIVPSMYPIKIWDCTELEENAVNMSMQELASLTTFLAGLQQGFFNIRKESKAVLQAEKEELMLEK